jgi:hypothetical protein
LKTKDKEIEKLKRENELLYKELDHMAKKMRKKSWGLFPGRFSIETESSSTLFDLVDDRRGYFTIQMMFLLGVEVHERRKRVVRFYPN